MRREDLDAVDRGPTDEELAEEVRLHEMAQSLTVGAVMTAIRTGRPIVPLSVDTLKREVNETFHRTVAR